MKTKEDARVTSGGMGGFLCPPGHPEHSYHVETDLMRRPENRGGMNLSSAVESDWLEEDAPEARNAARALLLAWECEKKPIADPEVQDWIAHVLGYFRGCYKGPGNEPECWHASDLHIHQGADTLPGADWRKHAGVHLIQNYYPDYKPCADDFARAYWGEKPKA